jgi:hypothetical protein
LSDALLIVEKSRVSNMSARTLLSLVIHTYRRILLIKVAPALTKGEFEALAEEEKDFIIRMSKMESKHLDSRSLVVLLDAKTTEKHALIEELPLELALIRILGEGK